MQPLPFIDDRIVADDRVVRPSVDARTPEALLAAAATLLSDQGPSALTVRRVAEAVNASTKVIYTHFGGKAGLLEALYLHSFALLTAALRGAVGEPASTRLLRMAAAYRQFAHSEPAFYDVMFGDLGRAWQAPHASRRKAWESFETLRDTVAAALPRTRKNEAPQVTRLIWAAMHGVVSLELRNLLGSQRDGKKLFDMAIAAVLEAHM